MPSTNTVELVDGFRKIEEKDAGKLNLSQIFIHYGKRNTYVPLSEVFVYINDSQGRRISSLRDFNNVKRNSTLTVAAGVAKEYNPGNTLDDADKNNIFVRDFEVPNEIDSYSIDGTDSSGNTQVVPYGLKRRVKMSPSAYEDSNYLYAELSGGKKEFIEKSQLGTFVGANFVPINDASLSINSIEELQGKELYYNDSGSYVPVTFVYKDNGYTPGEITRQETADFNNKSVKSYDENGNDVNRPVDTYYSEQILVHGAKPKLQIKNFITDENGRFLKVHFAGDTNESMVGIENLYSSYDDAFEGNKEKSIKKDSTTNFSAYVGKSLYAKVGDEIREIAPLTYEQANIIFDTIKNFREINEDYKAEENETTYLRLNNGKFVEEKKTARPIGYVYAENQDAPADKYLVYCRIPNVEGVQTRIVDRADVIKGKTKDGFRIITSVEEQKPRALKRSTNPLHQCDVIQTTNRPKINLSEECKVIYEYNEDRVANKEKLGIVTTAMVDFDARYKSGQYQLEDAIINGKLVKLDEKGKKYVISDTQLVDAPFADSSQYKSISSRNLRFDGKHIVGWGNHKAGDEIKDFYKSIGAFVPLMFSWGGLVTAVAIAALIPNLVTAGVIFGTIGAGLAIAPAVIAAKCWIQNRFLEKLKDPNKLNKEAFEKGYTEDLTNLFTATKENQIENIDVFLGEISNLEERLYNVSSMHYLTNLNMVDGVAQVSAGNAKLCDDYKEAIKQQKLKVKQLKKQLKSNPALKSEYEAENNKLTEMQKNFRLSNHATLADKEFEKKWEQLQIAKGYAICKYFDKQTNDVADTEMLEDYDFTYEFARLTPEEKEFLNDYELDVKTGEFKYVGKEKLSKEEKKNAEAKLNSLKERFKQVAKEYKTTHTDESELKDGRVENAVQEETYQADLDLINNNEALDREKYNEYLEEENRRKAEWEQAKQVNEEAERVLAEQRAQREQRDKYEQNINNLESNIANLLLKIDEQKNKLNEDIDIKTELECLSEIEDLNAELDNQINNAENLSKNIDEDAILESGDREELKQRIVDINLDSVRNEYDKNNRLIKQKERELQFDKQRYLADEITNMFNEIKSISQSLQTRKEKLDEAQFNELLTQLQVIKDSNNDLGRQIAASTSEMKETLKSSSNSINTTIQALQDKLVDVAKNEYNITINAFVDNSQNAIESGNGGGNALGIDWENAEFVSEDAVTIDTKPKTKDYSKELIDRLNRAKISLKNLKNHTEYDKEFALLMQEALDTWIDLDKGLRAPLYRKSYTKEDISKIQEQCKEICEELANIYQESFDTVVDKFKNRNGLMNSMKDFADRAGQKRYGVSFNKVYPPELLA